MASLLACSVEVLFVALWLLEHTNTRRKSAMSVLLVVGRSSLVLLESRCRQRRGRVGSAGGVSDLWPWLIRSLLQKAGLTNSETYPEVWVDWCWDMKLRVFGYRTADQIQFSQLCSLWIKCVYGEWKKTAELWNHESPWQWVNKERGLHFNPVELGIIEYNNAYLSLKKHSSSGEGARAWEKCQ